MQINYRTCVGTVIMTAEDEGHNLRQRDLGLSPGSKKREI